MKVKNTYIKLIPPVKLLKICKKSYTTARKLNKLGLSWEKSFELSEKAWLVYGCVFNKFGFRKYSNAMSVIKKLPIDKIEAINKKYSSLIGKIERGDYIGINEL